MSDVTTKQDIITQVANATGLSKIESRIVVEELIEALSEEIERKRTIELRGFGTFHVKERMPRPARNLKTGEVIMLKSRFAPLFRCSDILLKSIKERFRSGLSSR